MLKHLMAIFALKYINIYFALIERTIPGTGGHILLIDITELFELRKSYLSKYVENDLTFQCPTIIKDYICKVNCIGGTEKIFL